MPARDPRDYTPKHLADKILRSRSALEGERKQLTVLFADVKGSMELAEQLDPEEWHRIMDRFLQILTDGVHRFEGTVNQYTGDGIMALFGAPIAHEDHPQRACYAALQLREELARYATEVKRAHGFGFSIRMGLHSGEVVVGKIGDDLRMDYTARGHTVGLAQRMEALASPDTVYLTRETAQRVSGYFELEDLGEFEVKGVREPVGVHRLIGMGPAQTRFDVSKARGLTRFVGRDDDLRTLEAALEQAAAGNGQVVGVVAAAGTGKSRLCFEFTELCRAKGIEVLEGHAVVHGRNLPLMPILQIFRAYFGIAESDDPRAAREKIAGRVLLLDESYREMLPLLFDFFGVPDPGRPAPRVDGPTRRRQLFSVMRRLGEQDQGAAPHVVLVEDLHWLDEASAEFLEQLVEGAAETRSLLLVNFRPEFHAGWMQKSWYRQLPLAPLGPGAIRELLEDLLGDDASIRGLAAAIHRRTEGNPFFAEEVVRELIEAGTLQGARGAYRLVTSVDRLEVPATVQSLLASRIDRLAEREKHLLQTAAVIGVEFAQPLLAEVASVPEAELDAALRELIGAEFLYELSLYPAAEYAFKHPLTQEVALGSLLHERRAEIHREVARALEVNPTGDEGERAALISHHYEHAGELLAAARFGDRAAVWAITRDLPEAERQARRVVALLAEAEASDARDRLELQARVRLVQMAWRVLQPTDVASADFEPARALAKRVGDQHALATLLTNYALAVAQEIGAEALPYLEEAIRIADGTGDLSLRVGVRTPLMIFWAAGRLRKGLAVAEKIIELSADDPELGSEVFEFPPRLWAQIFRGATQVWLGRTREGLAALDRLPAAVQARSDPMLNYALSQMCAFTRIALGDFERARSEQRRGQEIAARLSFDTSPVGYPLEVSLLRDAGDHDEATRLGRQQPGEGRGSSLSRLALDAHLSLAELAAGEPERAVELAEGVLQAAPIADAHPELILALVAAADVLRETGAPRSSVETLLECVDDQWRRCEAALLQPLVLEGRARLAAREGDPSAGAALRAAQRLYEKLGAAGHARRLADELSG